MSAYDISEWKIIECFPKQQLYKWLLHWEEEMYVLILETAIHIEISWKKNGIPEGNTC